MHKFKITLLLIAIGLSVQAQQNTIKLSLTEAVEKALDSSYVSINARRDQAAALKQKWETTADGLPQINAGIDYNYNAIVNVFPISAGFEGGSPDEFIFVPAGPQQSMSLAASLNQLIFDGSYLVALKAAKTFLEFSDNANEKTRLEVRQATIRAYANALLVEENVNIAEKNLKTLKENLDETEKIYKEGLAEQEDVEQLQITYQQLKIQYNNAKRNLELSKQTLCMVLGIPVSSKIELTDKLENLALNQLADFDLLSAELDPSENVDYKIADNFLRQRTLEWQLERSKALPSLSAFATYGTNTFANDFAFLDSSTQWFDFSVIGVSMKIPLFSSLKRAKRTQRAEIAMMQAKTDFQQSVENIRLEFNQAKSDYKFALENYQVAEDNLHLAERIENKNLIKFKEGISTSFELRQAQLQLYDAQNQFLQSMLKLINSKTSLETVLNRVE